MGHDTHVDVADVHWFHGQGPVEMTGHECSHDCEHRSNAVIAWGPTFLHYELVRCRDCRCRAWRGALPKSHGGIRGSFPYLEPAVEPPQPETLRDVEENDDAWIDGETEGT